MLGGLWPVMWAGPASNWIAGLDLVLNLDPDTVVPGHGPVCTTREVQEMRELIVWIERETTHLLDRGLDPAKVGRELLASADVRQSPWASLTMPEALFITISTIDRHRRGDDSEPSRRERLRTLALAARFARAQR